VKRAWRWSPWIVIVVAVIVVLAVGTDRTSRPTLNSQVLHIAGEVRCPVCDGETAAQSSAAASVEIRAQIRQELQAGEDSDQILAGLVRSYGSGILEKPEANGLGLVVWVVPVVGAVLMASGLVFAFGRWRKRAPGEGPRVVPPDESHEPDVAVVASVPSSAPEAAGSGRRWPRVVLAGVGVSLIAGGAGWAVAASSTARLPGQTITGASLGSESIAQDLQRAQSDASKGDAVSALKEYQTVLQADPTEVDALTAEGWLLVQTQQPSLLQQGVGLLGSAERDDPDYAPSHLYRGIALLYEDDYADAAPELQWYLAHNPDPTLVAQVRHDLQQAETGAKGLPSGPAGA